MYLDDNNDAWLYLYHNNSGTNVGQIGYCVSSVMSTAQGSLFESAVTIYSADGMPEYYPAMIGAPSATIASGNINLFYNGTSLEDTGYVGGTLSYMQIRCLLPILKIRVWDTIRRRLWLLVTMI